MRYGDKFQSTMIHPWTKEKIQTTETYRYVSWRGYHTNRVGQGLWYGDRQVLGTCQFSVCGCAHEKSAKAKIRNYLKKQEVA